jgi:hypothetical protein
MGEVSFKDSLVGRLWDTVRAFFVAQWQDVWSVWVDTVPKTLDSIGEKMEKGIKGMDDPIWQAMTDYYHKMGFMNEETAAFFNNMKDLPPAGSLVMFVLVNFSMLNRFLSIMQDGPSAELMYKFNSQTQHAIADVQTLVRSAFIAPEKTQDIVETLRKWGYSDSQMDYLFLSNYTLYDPNTCRDLFLRGVLSGDQLFERMRELGYTDTRIKEMVQAWEVIPGPSDLFHLVGKEAFEKDMIEKIGLGDEFPEEQVHWLEKQGLSRYWAEKYWYAHWEQPSIQMGFEMLHRGIINDEELDMLFRAVEIPPFWRDKLTQMTYLPYTRVDTRRMYDWGVLDIQGVYNNYRDLGYDEEHAVNLTKWTVLQTDPEDKDISLGQILSNFEARVLDRNDAKEMIRALGYTEFKAEFLLVSAEYNMEEKIQKKRIEITREKYINRLIDKFDALKELAMLNLPHKQTDLLLEEWDLDLFRDKKFPSKTDLEKFYLQDIIKQEQYIEEMDKLGYSHKYIVWYLAVLIKKKGE